MTSTYIEHKHKNTGSSVLIHRQNAQNQYLENRPLKYQLKYGVHFPG